MAHRAIGIGMAPSQAANSGNWIKGIGACKKCRKESKSRKVPERKQEKKIRSRSRTRSDQERKEGKHLGEKVPRRERNSRSDSYKIKTGCDKSSKVGISGKTKRSAGMAHGRMGIIRVILH